MTENSSTLKANITKFKTKINSIRGDNTIVLSAFNELYGLVERLDYLKLDGLKRQELLLCFSFTNKYLSRINKAISKYEYDESFLLKQIMIASYIVKATYHNLIDASYRTESELAILTENITHAKSLKHEYEELIDKAEHLKNLENNIDDAEKTLEKIKELNEEIENNEDFLSNNLTESTKYLDDIRKQNLNAEKLVLTMKDHESIIEDKIKAFEVDADTVANQKEQFDKLLITSQNMFDKQQEEIQKIIEDANRASMAGSFNARKKEITRSIWFLDGCTVVFLGAIVLLLWNIFTSSYNQEIFSPTLFFSRIPITLPLIWLAWLASRKSAYLTRIKEDYAYKYSSAMAFEGYKKQVQEISPDLQEKLLNIAVTNLGENPTRLYNDKIKHTPIDLEALRDLIKSLPTDKIDELIKLIPGLKK